MPLEVVPDLFGRVKFRRVAGRAFGMKPWKGIADHVDGRSVVNSVFIPEQDDLPAQVLEQHTQELSHMNGLEVVLPELNIQVRPGAVGCNRECRAGGM